MSMGIYPAIASRMPARGKAPATEIGKKIDSYCAERGLMRYEFADAADIKTQTLSGVMRGRTNPPTRDFMAKVFAYVRPATPEEADEWWKAAGYGPGGSEPTRSPAQLLRDTLGELVEEKVEQAVRRAMTPPYDARQYEDACFSRLKEKYGEDAVVVEAYRPPATDKPKEAVDEDMRLLETGIRLDLNWPADDPALFA